MTDGKIIWLEETGSTNSWLSENEHSLETNTAVAARRPTAGRGQRGNSWESEPGSNLTLSLLLRPEGIHVARSFCLSEAVAVAVAETVEAIAPGIKVAIKWPNDIYVGNRKLGGILIENSLSGAMVGRCIVGLGLNLNQRRFFSDAPNPVSLWQMTGLRFDVDDAARRIAAAMIREAADAQQKYPELHSRYMSRLWRATGIHPFIETATGTTFHASVTDILPTGHIQLERTDGTLLQFAFKEISWPL